MAPPDGSQWMLKIFDLVPTTYRSFAEEYYEVDVPIEAVEHIYNHLTLTDDVVAALNPDLQANDLLLIRLFQQNPICCVFIDDRKC